MGNDGTDSEAASGDEVASTQPSSELIAQQQAIRRAKKRARQEAEAHELIEAGSGPRSAKKKGLEKKVWLDAEHKRQSPRKVKESTMKKSKTTPAAQGRKVSGGTGGGRSERKEPSRRSPSPLARNQRKAPKPQKHSKAKSNNAQAKGKRKRATAVDSEESASESSPGSSSEQSALTDPTDRDTEDDSTDSDNDINDKLSDSGLNALMKSEQAVSVGKSSTRSTSQVAATKLFEMDEADVTIADRSFGSSSGRSHPPTSDSEDPPQSILDSWQDNDEGLERQPPPKHSATQKKSTDHTKKSKASDARAEKFRNERASIVLAPAVPSKKKKRMESVTENQLTDRLDADVSPMKEEAFPEHTKVNNGALRSQNVYVCSVCHQAIKIVEKTLVFDEAWPELHRVSEYRLEVLLEAAKRLGKTGSQYQDIYTRLTKDTDFAKAIGKWVVDRLAHARSPVRQAALTHIAVFELGVGNQCIERVASLLTTDTYVYPGHWEDDNHGKPKWIVRGKEIYLNSGLINVMQTAFFSSPAALGFKFKEEYTLSHTTRREHEIPMALVALAATGLHAALDAWKDGNYIKKQSDKFDGETYKTIFNRHIKYLEGLKTRNIHAFHSIMSDIHAKVIGNVGKDTEAARGSGDALSVLDLSGFE